MQTKTLGKSKVEEFCAEIGQTELRAETVDKESKGAKKPKEVKFAVETMEMHETVKNKWKDARIAKIKKRVEVCKITMDAFCGLISTKLQKLSEVWKMDNCGTRRDHEPLDAVVIGNRSASEGLKSRANGVATSTSLVGRRVS